MMHLVSPWAEHGDLSGFVLARFRFLDMASPAQFRHAMKAVFDAFDSRATVGWGRVTNILIASD